MAEVNATVAGNASLGANASVNGSNLASTGILVATKEGILVAYTSLIVMALLPIFIGSFRSVIHNKKAKKDEVDVMSAKDAAMFPLVASCALFGLYVVFKVIGKEYVNLLLNVYIFCLSSFSFSRMLGLLVKPILPSIVPRTSYYFATVLLSAKKKRSFLKHLQEVEGIEQESSQPTTTEKRTSESEDASEQDQKKKVDNMEGIWAEGQVDVTDIACFVLAVAFGGWYLWKKHWIANNLLALSFALNGIEMISLDKVQNGVILLGGLFLYDIFWVFGTDVMVTVAKMFDAPIKLIFPMDFLEHGLFAKNFALLGLGDIVIPGVFIALMLRFDRRRSPSGKLYFSMTFLAYFLGLLTTVLVMHYFKHAQPALLYLVPACLGFPLLTALIMGDIKELWSFQDHPDEAKDASKKTN